MDVDGPRGRGPKVFNVNINYGVEFDDEGQVHQFIEELGGELSTRLEILKQERVNLTLEVMVKTGERLLDGNADSPTDVTDMVELADEAPMELGKDIAAIELSAGLLAAPGNVAIADEAGEKPGKTPPRDIEGNTNIVGPRAKEMIRNKLTTFMDDVPVSKEVMSESCIKLFKEMQIDVLDICGIGLLAGLSDTDAEPKFLSPKKMLIDDLLKKSRKLATKSNADTQTGDDSLDMTAASSIRPKAANEAKRSLISRFEEASAKGLVSTPMPVMSNAAYESVMPTTAGDIDPEVLRVLPPAMQAEIMNSLKNMDISRPSSGQDLTNGKGKKRKAPSRPFMTVDRLFGLKSDPGASSSRASDEREVVSSSKRAAIQCDLPYVSPSEYYGDDGGENPNGKESGEGVVDVEDEDMDSEETGKGPRNCDDESESAGGNHQSFNILKNAIKMGKVINYSSSKQPTIASFLRRNLKLPEKITVDMREKAHMLDESTVDKWKEILAEWVDCEKELNEDDLVYLHGFFGRLLEDRNFVDLITLTDHYYELVLKRFDYDWAEAYNHTIQFIQSELLQMDGSPSDMPSQLNLFDLNIFPA